MGTNHPLQFYAATKKANELMAHSYSHLYKLPTSGLRFLLCMDLGVGQVLYFSSLKISLRANQLMFLIMVITHETLHTLMILWREL